MTNSPLSKIAVFEVPKSVIQLTLDRLQEFGTHGYERLILWLGEVLGDRAEVVMAYVPPQHSIASEEGVGYFVTSDTLFALNRALAESRLWLLAQVHSHPTEAYHSEADDRFAIVTADGGLSLVVPDFGHAEPDPMKWAVYRLSGHEWIPLSDSRAPLIRIMDDE
jgi:hypothetical protein